MKIEIDEIKVNEVPFINLLSFQKVKNMEKCLLHFFYVGSKDNGREVDFVILYTKPKIAMGFTPTVSIDIFGNETISKVSFQLKLTYSLKGGVATGWINSKNITMNIGFNPLSILQEIKKYL